MAAKGLGSIIGDDLADAIIPDDLEKRVAKKAARKAGEAAVDAAVGAAVGASVNALTNRKKGPLGPPPPPPGLPNMKRSIRVMVAVNGQQYGPYEEAGLRNMIKDGSLTRETYVFVDGDTQWKFARDVPQVNALFNTPSIPTPPAPFAPAPPVPGGAPAHKQNVGQDGLSAKMNSLIDAAVADGEISDLERQVLIRNAQAEGVAMDEFVVILEARLFEQRKRLQSEQEQLAAHAAAVKASHHAAAAAAAPRREKAEVRKCPACGSVIMSVSAERCQECGYEFASEASSAASHNSIEDLMDRLEKIDQEAAGSGAASRFLNEALFKQKFEKKKVTIISAYSLPTGKKDLASFVSACKACADNATFGDTVGKAWKRKFQTALEEYTRRYSNDPEAMAAVAKYTKKKKFGLF